MRCKKYIFSSCAVLCNIVFYCCMALSLSAMAEESVSMDYADSLYGKSEYAEAADAYLAVSKVDGVSAALYFNLANCYAQIGDYGKAILYYSRAHRIDPSDKKIKNNLSYFTSKVEDSNRAELRGRKISVSPDPETFFSTVHRLIACDVRSDVWATFSVVSFILFLGGVAVYLFVGNVLMRKIGFFGGIILFIASVLCIVFSFMSAGYFDSHDRAVLQAYKTELLIEPSSDAKAATNLLCQGSVFEIVAEETDIDGAPAWYKVRMNADVEGWIKASDVEVI